MAEFSMDKYGGWEFTTGKRIYFSKDSIYFDEGMSDEALKGDINRSHFLIDEKLAEDYVFTIEEGIKHEKIIMIQSKYVKFYDYTYSWKNFESNFYYHV